MELNQADLIGKFQSFLKKIYGTDITMESKQGESEVCIQASLNLEEREAKLIEWVYQVLKGMEQDTILESITNWKQLLQLVWQQAIKMETQTKAVKEVELLRNYADSLPLPAHLIHIQLSTEHYHSDSIIKVEMLTEWMNLILELANTEKERCVIVPISEREAGVLLCVEDKSNQSLLIEDIIEECKAWVDVLLGELYVEAAVGVSARVDTVDSVFEGIEQALQAINIGRLLYGSHGIFAFQQLAMQRMMYDIVNSGVVKCETLLSKEHYELLGSELRDTAISFFRNQLNSSETARVLYLHRNSLLYRLDKIREITGYDIRKFEEAAALWTALNLWRISTS